METYDRSGMRIGGFKIGRWACLRQEYLLPGDQIKPQLKGFFRLGALREQLVMPLHISILIAVSPIRWWDNNIVDMVKDVSSTDDFDVLTVPGGTHADSLGLGQLINGRQYPSFFLQHWNAMLNWHLKWPEDPARALTTFPQTDDERRFGTQAVNLPSLSTRMLDGDLTAADEEVSTTGDKFALTDLSEMMKEWRAKRGREWLAQDRYQETLQDLYHAKGTAEVEKIPMIIGEHRQWMPGMEIWATDANNLGSVAGIMQADLDYTLPMTYTAPEHSVMSYHLCFRIPPVWGRGISPFVTINDSTWQERIGDPTMLAESKPVEREREFFIGENGGDIGLQPAGQQYRAGWNSVDEVIESRDSFMYYELQPNSATQFRYAPSVDHAFRSLSIGHGIFRCDFRQRVKSHVPLPMSSVMAGG